MVTLTISLDQQTGAVQVNGPLHDRVLCYGLLGIAHEILTRQHEQMSESGNGKPVIVVPKLQVVQGPRS